MVEWLKVQALGSSPSTKKKSRGAHVRKKLLAFGWKVNSKENIMALNQKF
jgi:hypothetical protein